MANRIRPREPLPEWSERSSCKGVDPDLFFPEGPSAALAQAKEICRGCPVRNPCLDYAIDNNERFGVWGGTSERERRRITRARRAQGKAPGTKAG